MSRRPCSASVVPPEPPVFFADRNLGRVIWETLREAGIRIERHLDHFVHNSPDDEWLVEVGRRGWYVLTLDRKIRYRPNEKAAVLEAGVGLFILVGKNATHAELARNFVATRPRLYDFIETQQRPFIARIYRGDRPDGPGRVVQWIP